VCSLGRCKWSCNARVFCEGRGSAHLLWQSERLEIARKDARGRKQQVLVLQAFTACNCRACGLCGRDVGDFRALGCYLDMGEENERGRRYNRTEWEEQEWFWFSHQLSLSIYPPARRFCVVKLGASAGVQCGFGPVFIGVKKLLRKNFTPPGYEANGVCLKRAIHENIRTGSLPPRMKSAKRDFIRGIERSILCGQLRTERIVRRRWAVGQSGGYGSSPRNGQSWRS